MRSLTTLLLILFTFTLTILSAQSAWVPAPVPQGEAVPNQFILRFNGGFAGGSQRLAQEFDREYQIVPVVQSLSTGGTDYLVEILPRDVADFCAIVAPGDPNCSICQIIGNPGGGGPMSEAEGIWPNYYHSYGYDSPLGCFTPPGTTTTTPPNEYNPFAECPDREPLPFGIIRGTGQTEIAILDTGIDADHPNAHFDDFFTYQTSSGVASIVEQRTVPGSSLPASQSLDPNGHGTAVGYLAAHHFVNQNEQDKVKLISYRVLDENGRGTLADLLLALDDAIASGVDIINLSLGFQGLGCDQNLNEVFDPYFQWAKAKKTLVFASAGNDGNDISVTPQWPAAESGHHAFLTVAASECGSDNLWPLSNSSQQLVELIAPGADITVPYVWSCDPSVYISVDGTSFATPLAVAVVASYVESPSVWDISCLFNYYTNNNTSTDVRYGPVGDLDQSPCEVGPSDPGGAGPRFLVDGQLTKPADDFAVFPNPFSSEVSVSVAVDASEPRTIEILDVSGKMLVTTSVTGPTTSLNVPHLPTGVYYLRISGNGNTQIQKVIKQ